MAKDAHDDPYSPQHRRFVLPCSECGTVARVYGLLKGESINYPDKPLCRDCMDIFVRVWGEPGRFGQENPLSIFSPPEHDVEVIEVDGELIEYHVVLCPRCNGTGWHMGGQCFRCAGSRFALQSDKGVQRTARWWQTYQQNRVT